MRTETHKRNNRRIASVTLVAAALVAGVTATAPAGAATAQPTAESAGVAAQASWPVVKSGQRGVDVATVQLLLTARGFKVSADGVFGSGTAAKVKAFQKSRKLAADGVVGAKTWAKLIVTVRQGSKGTAVQALQRQLNDNGYRVSVDGVFGSGTASNVKAFQKAKGLSADGIVGPSTWAALVNGGGGGGGGGSVQLVFDKNQSDQRNSRLYVVRSGKTIATYRAGSGSVPNDCTKNRGWLPNGTYAVGGHWRNYDGSVIKGFAIRLADKKCANGTLRNELFIHSEMTRNGGQGPNTPKDDPNRWEGVNDYYSNGCIKLTPADIKGLFGVLDKAGWPKSLKVVS